MRRIIILGVVIAVLVVGYTGAWFWVAHEASSRISALASADGETSPRLTCTTLAIGGFPFGFDVTCEGATLVDGDLTTTAAGVQASVQVYNPFHLLVTARGPLGFADAFSGSQSRLDFKSAIASGRLTGWRIGRVSLVVEQPVWNDTVLDDVLIAKARHLEAHLIDLPEKHDEKAGLGALGEYVQIDELDAPGAAIVAGHATLEAQLLNLPDDVRTYGDGDLLQRWQAAGGQFILSGFKGGDSTGSFTVTGNATLDTQGHVDGQIKAQSTGIVERIETQVPEQLRGLVLGTRAEDGSYSQTINIAAGVVFAGLVPAAIIPPLW